RHAAQRLPVNHEMILVDLLDVRGNFMRPRWCWINFVTGFPAENGWLVTIRDTGVGVFSRENVMNGCFEVVNDLSIIPESFGRLATKCRVFANATPPLGLVNKWNDHSNSLAVGNFNHLIKRAKAVLVEFAWS